MAKEVPKEWFKQKLEELEATWKNERIEKLEEILFVQKCTITLLAISVIIIIILLKTW